jgi:hypothetical protein
MHIGSNFSPSSQCFDLSFSQSPEGMLVRPIFECDRCAWLEIVRKVIGVTQNDNMRL